MKSVLEANGKLWRTTKGQDQRGRLPGGPVHAGLQGPGQPGIFKDLIVKAIETI